MCGAKRATSNRSPMCHYVGSLFKGLASTMPNTLFVVIRVTFLDPASADTPNEVRDTS